MQKLKINPNIFIVMRIVIFIICVQFLCNHEATDNVFKLQRNNF